MSKYKVHLQLCCSIDELSTAAYVGPDEMRGVVDDIDTMSN
jgi:hypothetical protein